MPQKKIIAFGASSSRRSINKRLANWAAQQIPNTIHTLLDLNDFEMPIFSVDREENTGIPQLAHDFKAQLKSSDGIVISFAEHNGAYSAAFKNVMDWISRIDNNVWENKPMLLLATSPGKRGGATVLDIAVNKFKWMTSNTITHFSLPSFFQNFSDEEGILDEELSKAFRKTLEDFNQALLQEPTSA